MKTENLAPKEELKSFLFSVKLVLGIFIVLGLASLIVRFAIGLAVPNMIFALFLIWILIYIFYYHYIQKKESLKSLSNFYFIKSVVDLFLITAAIHFIGGVEWIGAIFYLTVLSWASAVLPKNKVFILALIAVLFYLILALLEYFGLLAHHLPFAAYSEPYQSPVYIAIQVLVLIIIFLFVSQNYGTLAENLRESRKRLINYQERLEESKNILEIRVSSRTRELQKLANNLEKEVSRRTKEAQARVEELEKFKKLAVGRELKMLELKKEIKKLKEYLKLKSE